MDTIEFGRKIQKARNKEGVLQTELAHKLGLKADTMVSHIERGTRLPSIDRVPLLAHVLHLDTKELCMEVLQLSAPAAYSALFGSQPPVPGGPMSNGVIDRWERLPRDSRQVVETLVIHLSSLHGQA
jgi:transcriptional regulator with XRE-family HTH domain